MSTNCAPQITGYTIKSVLGVGGCATVYLAQHHVLQRDVALKVMHPSLVHDTEFSNRFLLEARDTASISDHRNIVTIYDFGCIDDIYFIAMQYMPGANLSQQLLTPHKSNVKERWLYQLAESLSYIHSRGFIHRDIKPANVLFSDSGEAVLADFGVARLTSRQTLHTNPKTVVGTARYMSPEQCRGSKILDARSDLYSLGVVFHEMLTGQPPFQAEDSMALMLQHLNSPTPLLPDRYKHYQPILERLMAKEPDARFTSADQLMQAMRSSEERRGKPDKQLHNKQANNIAKPVTTQKRSTSSLLTLALAIALPLIGSIVFFIQQLPETLPALALRCPEITQSQMDERDALLALADVHHAIGRIDHPPGANALDTYKLALQIDPCNTQITETVTAIRSAQL